MTHAQNEVHELIDAFKEFEMTETQAMFATLKVLQGRYREALINGYTGSRPSYWDKAMDYLEELVNKKRDEAVHSSTR